jgi:epsilon-lactone hydrolase
MASEQSEAVRALWTSWMEAARANPNETPDDLRARVEHWGDLTAEPDGVDNVEIEVAGLPALSAIPKGSAGDRVVLSFHGGGFVSGSIHTHRKLFGHLAKAIGARALITDYRGTPMHSHPVPLEDTTAAYRWVLERESMPDTSQSPAIRLGAGWPSRRCCGPVNWACRPPRP